MNTKQNYIIKKSNKAAFITELYNSYGRKMYSCAISKWQINEDDTWELIYKTLYKVNDSVENYQFETEEKFASFIFKIFINYLRNHYRDKKKQGEHFTLQDISEKEFLNQTEHPKVISTNNKLKILNEELDKVEDWQRMLLLMRSEGRSYSEIATYINKPESQLKVYYQRLKETISKKINERL